MFRRILRRTARSCAGSFGPPRLFTRTNRRSLKMSVPLNFAPEKEAARNVKQRKVTSQPQPIED
eukprot:scaffold27835_cov122-Isochrysis_galbana.AAC.4